MTKILALDISSVSTGYAFFDNTQLIEYDSIITSKWKRHSERLYHFEQKIDYLLQKYSPDFVIAEDIYKGRNVKTHKILSLYHGIAYKLCFNYTKDDPIVLYSGEIRSSLSKAYNVSLKKKGVKDKLLTFDFINKLLNLNFTFEEHNDITDAIAIGLAVIELEKIYSLDELKGCARSSITTKNKKKAKSK